MTAGEVNLTEHFVDGDHEEAEIFGGSSIQNRLEISQLAIKSSSKIVVSLTDGSMRGLITTLTSPVQLDFRHSWQGATREQRVWRFETLPGKRSMKSARGPDSVFPFVTCEPSTNHCTIAETGRLYE